jgi:glycosyltransferase involved in cell wall biosynthesis
VAHVSVIMPTYNRAHLLGRSIPSVLNQTFRDLELIVVDDGSTDSTPDTVAQFQDERIRYLRHETNRGVSAARNTGVMAATGAYVAFNDSDDEWMAHKLEKQLGVFQSAGGQVGVVYSDMLNIVNGREEHYRGPHVTPEDELIHQKFLAFQVGCHMVTATVKRQCFEEAGPFDEKLQALEDAEFFMRVSRQWRFYHMPEPLVRRFVTPGSLEKNSERIARAKEYILSKYYQDIARAPKVLVYYHVDIAIGLFYSFMGKVAGRRIREGLGKDLPGACAHLFKGLRRDLPETILVFFRPIRRAVSKRWRRLTRAFAGGGQHGL